MKGELHDAWMDLVQAKANCDQAIADKQWHRAEGEAQKMRRACSDLEEGIQRIYIQMERKSGERL
jgi:hypothetical protein